MVNRQSQWHQRGGVRALGALLTVAILIIRVAIGIVHNHRHIGMMRAFFCVHRLCWRYVVFHGWRHIAGGRLCHRPDILQGQNQ